MNKHDSRIRRARKTRVKIANSEAIRLTVHRSNNNIYAQILAPKSNQVLASASSVEASIREKFKLGNTVAAAGEVGKLIAERAKKAGVTEVAFDRSGYQYHGRVKALAESARENGLNC